MLKILVVFTGGTIGCAPPVDGVKNIKQSYFLIDGYKERCGGEGVAFDTLQPLETLSENMTVSKWNTLLGALKKVNFAAYDGVIITHGTDTLAYTASLLGILLSHLNIPVMLVSSGEHIYSPVANGHKNFEDAVAFIRLAGFCGVYVPFSYDLTRTIIYEATQLKQSQPFIHRFESAFGEDFGYMENGGFYTKSTPIQKNTNSIFEAVKELDNCVMLVQPYPGLDYSRLRLDGIKAVLHGTYHSYTFCVEGGEASAGYLYDRCEKHGVKLYFAPFESGDIYASTDAMRGRGARFIAGSSLELAYAKLLIAYSAFDGDEEISEFLALRW